MHVAYTQGQSLNCTSGGQAFMLVLSVFWFLVHLFTNALVSLLTSEQCYKQVRVGIGADRC